jgi:dTDP-4-dehydrorhamnose reductase
MTDKKRVLILGSLGMLGQELVRAFSDGDKYEVTAWDREDIDITDFPLAEAKISALKPAMVINAVAYNAVDKCETDDEEYKKALLLNREVPKFLAQLSKKLGYILIHYSTDYVFDGALEANKAESGCCGGGCCGAGSTNQVGYNEEALPNPLSRYGESKYAGERAVREEASDYYLIRLYQTFWAAREESRSQTEFLCGHA